MDEQYTPIISEAERLERRRQRMELRRKKELARRRRLIIKYLPAAVLVLAVLSSLVVWAIRREPEPEPEPTPPPAPKTADQLFEEKLKAFMTESDSKISGIRAEHRTKSRRR